VKIRLNGSSYAWKYALALHARLNDQDERDFGEDTVLCSKECGVWHGIAWYDKAWSNTGMCNSG